MKLAYSKSEAASIVGVSEPTIERAIKAGDLMAKRIGTRVVIPDEELKAWFDALPSALEDA
ncbi:HTH DNA binding protein [Gordonia phage Daredevil]|uniref:Excise n=1 Tax=Gordonia phage Daredevil TaxID=2283286 RepID=A0A345MIT9_9CAUD|nr:HTH DNA binding protein [Gordonia phage Daredevil]AXH70470.1 excise [Gordonia phage Daredevil]